MDCKLIAKKADYALIQRGSNMQQYAVVNSFDEHRGDWAWTVGYAEFGKYSNLTEIEALQSMIELFRYKTEDNYITRSRLEELATHFKDGLLEDDQVSAMEYFNEVCEMSDAEKEFFEIETESGDEHA